MPTGYLQKLFQKGQDKTETVIIHKIRVLSYGINMPLQLPIKPPAPTIKAIQMIATMDTRLKSIARKRLNQRAKLPLLAKKIGVKIDTMPPHTSKIHKKLQCSQLPVS